MDRINIDVRNFFKISVNYQAKHLNAKPLENFCNLIVAYAI